MVNNINISSALLLRGLDVLSTEESVLQGIQHAGSDLPIRSVRIGRDPLTNTSRGVCYIELNSVLDSMQLHNKLAHSPPTIDNKQVSVLYKFSYLEIFHYIFDLYGSMIFKSIAIVYELLCMIFLCVGYL